MSPTRLALLLAVALAVLAPAAASAAPADRAAPEAKRTAPADPAAVPLALARRLSSSWGRCPTSRPAHRLLAIAARTRPLRPRVLRARAAVRAWRGVVMQCRKPVVQPLVVVLDSRYRPPAA